MSPRISRAVAAAAVAMSLCACTPAEAPPAASPAPTPSIPPSIPASVTLVSLSDLRAAVPELRGWTRGEISGQEIPPPDRSTHVNVTFTRGTESMQLELADTGGSERAIEALEKMAGSTTNRAVENGYFKGTTLGAFPAVESWNTVQKIGELSVLIRRRYILHIAGAGLPNAAPMRALAEAVDKSRLH